MADEQLSTAQNLKEQLLQNSSVALAKTSARLQDTALPEPGNEAWKYSPVNRLYEVLLEAQACTTNASLGIASPDQTAVAIKRWQRDAQGSLALAEEMAALFDSSFDSNRYPITNALACDFDEVVLIDVDGESANTIELEYPDTGNRWLHIRLLDNASTTLIERFDRPRGATLTSVELKQGARLSHACSYRDLTDVHWRLNSVNQAASSSYTLNQASLGGRLQRIDNHVNFLEPGASAQIVGCALCDDDNRSDLQNVLEHSVPHCESSQRYHGVANQAANLTFGGRIHIHEHARGTNAHLTNSNLVLDDRAQINTKPELEIYNDDVSCSHGATIGRLEEEALFYLRSRGIKEDQARSLLLGAFVNDALNGPDAENTQAIIQERLSTWTIAT